MVRSVSSRSTTALSSRVVTAHGGDPAPEP
jgi:hypothetical protein